MYRSLFYDPAKPSGFSTVRKLKEAVGATKTKKPRRAPDAWLQEQDAFTMHRPVRKRFPRNPYTITNALDVWECDLLDVQSLSKYNDRYRYLLTVIDVFQSICTSPPCVPRLARISRQHFGPSSAIRGMGHSVFFFSFCFCARVAMYDSTNIYKLLHSEGGIMCLFLSACAR
jgi:hypothetical protein